MAQSRKVTATRSRKLALDVTPRHLWLAWLGLLAVAGRGLRRGARRR